jgi:IS5 family transposase
MPWDQLKAVIEPV